MNFSREETSLILENYSDKRKQEDPERELREHFRKLGFYRENPTPELLREAQQVYYNLEWPTPTDLDGDPLPCPPRTVKDEILRDEELRELDSHALETPYTYLGQHVRFLVEYLIRPAVCDVHKARLLTRWLGRCLDEDYIKYLPRTEWSHPESTAGYLWRLRRRQMDYDELFHVLCKYAGLKCANVDGCVRNTIKYEVGDDFDQQRKSWTAVLLDGDWRLLDVRWICEAAYGVLKNNWCLIEDEKGKVEVSRAIKENKGSFKTHCRFREFYFFTDPEIFIYDHFPNEEKWQLLARKVSYEEARDLAALRADFFRHRLTLRSHPKCVLDSEDGNVTFVIGLPEGIRMSFVYKLYRSKDSRDAISPSRSALDRYVFMERDSDEGVIRVIIRFPSEGKYLFELHGSQNTESHHALLLTYVISCTGIIENVKALPTNIRQEWGPGEDTRDMGMVPVTHRKGQVEADDGDAEITFNLEKDLEFKHDLIKGEKDEPVSQGHVMHTIENGKMNINVRLPEPGEYALNVLAKEKFKKTRFAPACSYLVSCDEEPLQSKPFPNIEGRHVGPNENFQRLGFRENSSWPSYINNLVTGELSMEILKPSTQLVSGALELEEGEQTETFDSYVICDTMGNRVTVTAMFPKSGTYKLTLFSRNPDIDAENETVPIYVKIIEVILPTLTGMPTPIHTNVPDWCHGYHLKEPRSLYLPSRDLMKLSIAIPEATSLKVKGHPECKLKKNDDGFWEGYLRTGPPRSTVEILASETLHSAPFKILTYQVVSKEELLQIEVEQEQLFKTALDELQTLEAEKHVRLLGRLKQAMKDSSRVKIQKYLTRLKELKPDTVDVEMVRAEKMLRELVAQEEKDIARKELRRATRICDILSLEVAIQKFYRLKLEEEDGDITAAEEILQSLKDKQDDSLSNTRDASQQTNDDQSPFFIGNHSGVHIYVMPDGRIQHNEMAPSECSLLMASRITKDTENHTPSRTPALDDSADEIKQDFNYLALDSSTPRKKRHGDSSRMPELLREHLKKSHMMDDEETEPAVAAISVIENDDAIEKPLPGRRSWKSRTMDVFTKYWHVMQEKSELSKQTLNDEIEHEIQRLRHINQMCRKMARAARKIGSNYDKLIDSEQIFNDILTDPSDGNDSLTEDLCSTSAILQHDVITVEEGMKAAFDGFVSNMDRLCSEMVGKAESTAKELEQTRLEMATEELLSTSTPTPTRSDSGMGGSTDRNSSMHDPVRTSFYAARNTILEELRSANAATEEEIRRHLSGLQKTMAEYQAANTSRGGNSSSHGNISGHDFAATWKI